MKPGLKLILASTSPRRRELLSALNIPFEVVAPTFIETPTDLTPEEEALYFAEQKARSVASHHPDCLILGSDTLIVCEGQKLGKPKDRQDAKAILLKLSGRGHGVLTAVVLLDSQGIKKHLERATVTFRHLSNREIEDYIATGESLDKAGAYAIQGEGRKLISKIEGERDAIVGLPIQVIREWLI